MRKVIKLISIIMAAALIIGVIPFSASAEEYGGSCGVNLTWALDTMTGVLTISGTGDMDSLGNAGNIPWISYRNRIKSVVVSNGVTSIGRMAFYKFTELSSVRISNSVTSISVDAFVGCSGLTNITVSSSNECFERLL